MFHTNILTFDKSSTPQTKRLLICGSDGIGSVTIDKIADSIRRVVYPIGSIIDYHAPNASNQSDIPDGWKVCDGSEYNINTYPKLFNILNSKFLPDLSNRINVMRDYNEFGILSDLGQPAVKLGLHIGIESEIMTLATLPKHKHAYEDTRRWGSVNFSNDQNDGGRAMLPLNDFDSEVKNTTSFGVTTTVAITNKQPTIKVLKIIKLR